MTRAFRRSLPWLLGFIFVGWTASVAVSVAQGDAPGSTVDVLDWQKVINSVLGASGILGVILLFLNQRLTAREAARALARSEEAQGTKEFIANLQTQNTTLLNQVSALGQQMVELRTKYADTVDRLQQEKDELHTEYEKLRLDRHDVAKRCQAQELQHEVERGEWNLERQRMEQKLKELATRIAVLEGQTPQTGA